MLLEGTGGIALGEIATGWDWQDGMLRMRKRGTGATRDSCTEAPWQLTVT
jgi:hypothetical protein